VVLVILLRSPPDLLCQDAGEEMIVLRYRVMLDRSPLVMETVSPRCHSGFSFAPGFWISVCSFHLLFPCLSEVICRVDPGFGLARIVVRALASVGWARVRSLEISWDQADCEPGRWVAIWTFFWVVTFLESSDVVVISY
jgi:hypothetical protein